MKNLVPTQTRRWSVGICVPRPPYIEVNPNNTFPALPTISSPNLLIIRYVNNPSPQMPKSECLESNFPA